MSSQIINAKIQTKYDELTKWQEENPILLEGEMVIATINSQKIIKIGDGKTNFNNLPSLNLNIQGLKQDNSELVIGGYQETNSNATKMFINDNILLNEEEEY